ncbi:AAA family ATPase [Pseudoalteromonas sp. NZS71]|uniref:KAP family P-loop NTPase fold protein n=1 Tax=Pseudoalteromonas sp. NZS71 TaxID=2792052 RepID=UPI0018CD8392|nr:P-loop NTPase fold protein [Pseudoalteromonas sp. NZS71]MBH0062171.1 AAA family ATPase [Pseudoalteromonas sp. NZS71]
MSLKHSHNDQATAETCLFLGTESFVNTVAEDIEKSDSPRTIAITGYWGSGKTSCLAGVYKKVTATSPAEITNNKQEQTGKYTGIWFEAWRYQNEVSPIIALLHCIKNHFSSSKKFIDEAGKLASVSVLGALTVLDGVIKQVSGLSGFSKISEIGEKYEKDNLLSRLAADQINDALTQAVSVLLGKNKEKLVIFIDDLDRCEPENAYKLLEGLKLYLSIPNCTVVLAIDQQQIERFLQKQFINLMPERKTEIDNQYSYLGVEYLEKLCQEAYRLPIPNQKQKSDFFISHLKLLFKDENGSTVIEDLNEILESYDVLPANPRRLKMISNKLAGYLRKVDGSNVKGVVNEDCSLFKEFNNIIEPKRSESFAAIALIVSSLSVSYRRIYESIELRADAARDIFDFVTAEKGTNYTTPSSAFYELNKDHRTTDVQAKYEHPSDLSIFKLKPLFDEVTGLHIYTQSTPKTISEIMHQFVNYFNHNQVN